MLIKGEKGRLIIVLNSINSELYPDILKSLLRFLQTAPEGTLADDRLNLLLLLEDLMPESKQMEKMIECGVEYSEIA